MNRKTTLLYLLPVLLAAGIRAAEAAPAGNDDKAETYTVIEVAYYDGKVTYEAVKTKEVFLRAQEIWAEFPIWKEAHIAAQRQWHEWFSAKTPENRGRAWVLPNPVPPRFQKKGVFADEIEAGDKVKEFEKAHIEKINEAQQNLYKNRTQTWQQMMYLNNLHYNSDLLRELMPGIRKKAMERDRQDAQRLAESKKKQVWEMMHLAEQEARRRLQAQAEAQPKKEAPAEAAKAKDGKDAPAAAPAAAPAEDELDILEVHRLTQELGKPVLDRMGLTESQWYAIWEEGYLNKWPIPGQPEGEKVADEGDGKTGKRGRNKK